MAVIVRGDEELRQLFKKMPQRLTANRMVRVFRKAAKPVVKAEDAAAQRLLNPTLETFHTKRSGVVRTAFPLTIARNIGIIRGKSKEFPNIVVGVKYKKRGAAVDDPWFANFLAGTKGRGKKGSISKGRFDWTPAGIAKLPQVGDNIVREFEKILLKGL
jgi:hypothetical protein